MGTTSTVQGQVLKLGFRGARLPLTIAERVVEITGADVATWPPVLLYDTVEGQAKQLVGRLVGDEDLASEGARQRAAARHRAGAEVFSSEAEEIRRAADDRLQEDVTRAEHNRDRVHEEAEARKAEVREEEKVAKRQARARAAARKQAVEKAARTRAKAVEAKERQAELARVEAEAKALEKQSEAVQAERVVTAIDEHLEDKKATRRNGDGAT